MNNQPDKGSLFLIPSFLSEDNLPSIMAPYITDVIQKTDYYLVEEIRTARRFISRMKTGRVIEEMHFFTLDKKTSYAEAEKLIKDIPATADIGVISEAGAPGVADPGAVAVAIAHKLGRKVVPLPGPSSILLALMASGFQGQRFTFQGYLPIDRPGRIKQIKQLEKNMGLGETQIFMETPFRNNHLLEDLLKELHPDTLLCIASDITASEEFIKTLRVADWRSKLPDLNKKPTIFLIGKDLKK